MTVGEFFDIRSEGYVMTVCKLDYKYRYGILFLVVLLILGVLDTWYRRLRGRDEDSRRREVFTLIDCHFITFAILIILVPGYLYLVPYLVIVAS